MNSNCIELKIMHCKDLKAFNFFQKLLVYVLVSIVSDDPNKDWKQNQPQRTPTDKEADTDPEWNHEMRFDLNQVSFQDCDHLFVHFDLRHEGQYFGDKTIGIVRVPLKDLIQEITGITRFVNYEIRTPDGKPNGVLTFSFTVSWKIKDMGTHVPENTGYPIVHHPDGIQYPTVEVQSSSQVGSYPSLDLQEVHYSLLGPQHSSQENYYPPPESYYGPPPPPLHGPPPPPPPQMVHVACYYDHPQPSLPHPWPSGVYDYTMHGNWSPSASQSYGFPNTEMWRNDLEDGRQSHLSFLNGRK